MKYKLVILFFVSLISCQLQFAAAQEQQIRDAINIAIVDYMANPRVGENENYTILSIDTTDCTIEIAFLFLQLVPLFE